MAKPSVSKSSEPEAPEKEVQAVELTPVEVEAVVPEPAPEVEPEIQVEPAPEVEAPLEGILAALFIEPTCTLEEYALEAGLQAFDVGFLKRALRGTGRLTRKQWGVQRCRLLGGPDPEFSSERGI